jgi:hypothetical protein
LSAIKNVKIGIYKTIIFTMVLYGCEASSLILREEQRLKMFQNRIMRSIFELKRDQELGGWKRLYNEELHDLYSLPSIIRMM